MVDWRRNQGDNNHHQEGPTTSARSQSKKPPPGAWQPTVPLWEKKFCTIVGSIPWGKLVESKKVMSYYDNVVQWNDSAGEEAFHNAKSRFWAEINGLPCDISLPDPDIYIDEIDWNPEIDPELVLDLDREFVVPEDRGKDAKVGFEGNALVYMNRPVPCTGWGDDEEKPIKTVDNLLSSGLGFGDSNRNSTNEDNPWEFSRAGANTSGWGDAQEDPIKTANNFTSEPCARDRNWTTNNEGNPWESNPSSEPCARDRNWTTSNEGNSWVSNPAEANIATEDRKWGNVDGKSWGWKQWENNKKESETFENRGANGGWGTWEGNWKKREGATQYMSRYKTSRFQSDDHNQLGGGGWKSGRGKKRVNFVYERPVIDKKPFAQRPWSSIHQIGHHGSGEAGHLWRSWEK